MGADARALSPLEVAVRRRDDPAHERALDIQPDARKAFVAGNLKLPERTPRVNLVNNGYENLSLLFPSTMLTPTIGSKLFGSSDVTLTINGQDGSRIIFKRAFITQFTNLELSTEKDLFSADVKWTCLIAGGSTLTMQVARLLEPRPERRFSDKLAEMIRAVLALADDRRYHFTGRLEHDAFRRSVALEPRGSDVLVGALLVGVQVAKALSLAWGVPLVRVNHLEGHLLSPLLSKTPPACSE